MADRDRTDHGEFLHHFMAAQPSVRAYVMSLVRDFHATEDVLQEVAAAAWRAYADYDSRRPFEGWAIRIAHNASIDDLRKRKRSRPLPDDVLGALADEAAQVGPELSERRSALAGCLDRLGEAARSLVDMRYERDLSARQIAEREGKSFEAVRKAIARARAWLVRCTERALSRGKA